MVKNDIVGEGVLLRCVMLGLAIPQREVTGSVWKEKLLNKAEEVVLFGKIDHN